MKKALMILGVTVVSVATALFSFTVYQADSHAVELTISEAGGGPSIEGSVFQLYECTDTSPGHIHDGDHCTLTPVGDAVSSNSNGKIEFKNLDDTKTYFVEEVKAPAAYSKADGLLKLSFADGSFQLSPVGAGSDYSVLAGMLTAGAGGYLLNAPPASGQIECFYDSANHQVPAGGVVSTVSVPLGTAVEDIRLPQYIKAKTTEGSFVQVEADWKCPSFDGNTVDKYVFTFELNGYTYEGKLPCANVFVITETRPVKDIYEPGTGEVSSLSVNKTTGTAPWDADDAPGNDSGAKNDIVRSYDSISYNILYTLNIKDEYQDTVLGYNHADMYVRATLTLPESQASFDLDSMQWLQNASVEKTSNGQVLTGYYPIENNDETKPYVLPGNGTVRFVVNVGCMTNGSTIQPVFEMWLDDGENTGHSALEEERVIPSATTVSSVVNYDIGLMPLKQSVKEPNISTGKTSGGSYGALCNVGIYVSIHGSGGDKGLKGLYIPGSIDVSFDLLSNYYVPSTNKLKGSYNSDSFTAVLWDYASIKNSSATTGTAGRSMIHENATKDNDMGRYHLPYSFRSEGSPENSAYDSGILSVVNPSKKPISVSLTSIKTDTLFPKYAGKSENGTMAAVPVGKNIIASGVVEIMFPLEDNRSIPSGGDLSYKLTVEISNAKINGTAASDIDSTNNMVSWDRNAHTSSHGDSRTLQLINSRDYSTSVTHAARGDVLQFYCNTGQDSPFDSLNFRAKYPTMAVDHMVLFDGDVFEPVITDGSIKKLYMGYYTSMYPDVPKIDVNNFTGRVWYIAKADGTSWVSDEEKSLCNFHTFTDEKDGNGKLKYRVFATMDELKASLGSDACCVGLYFEIRNPKEIKVWNHEYIGAYFDLRVKDDAPVSKASVMKLSAVLISTNTDSSVGNPATNTRLGRTEKVIAGATVAIDTGDLYGHKITDTLSYNRNYIEYVSAKFDSQGVVVSADKSIYQINHGGTVWGGTGAGNTIFIVGERDNIVKEVAMKAENGETRSTFNVDQGERYADYVLSPSVIDSYTLVSSTDKRYTDVTITDTLPADLHYIPGSCYLGGSYVQPADKKSSGSVNGGTRLRENSEAADQAVSSGSKGSVYFDVSENPDGTTTLVWKLCNVQINKTMPRIYYSTRIGDPEDIFSDVYDGQQLINKASIVSDGSYLPLSSKNGNLASNTIKIYKKANDTFVKRVKSAVVDQNDDIVYYIDYYNSSPESISSLRIRDVLPFDGDSRGCVIHGSYTVSVSAQCMNGSGGSYSLYYTMDESVRGYEKTPFGMPADPALTMAASSVNGRMTDFGTLGQVSMIEIVGTDVQPGAQLRINVTISPKNVAGDKYRNSAAFVEPGAAPILASSVQTDVKLNDTEISGTKTLLNKILEKDMFTFELVDMEGNVVSETTNRANGQFKFEPDFLTGPGTFRYTVREQIPDAVPRGYTYDDSVYEVVVKADENEFGELEIISVKYSSTINFVNRYDPEPAEVLLEARKQYTGSTSGLTGGDFSFVLNQSGMTPVEVSNEADGSISFPAISIPKEGIYTYTIREVIPDIPDKHISYDSKTVTVTVKVVDKGGYLEAEDIRYSPDATFRNVYTPDIPVPGDGKEYAEIKLYKVCKGIDVIDRMFEFELKDTASGQVWTEKNRGNGEITFMVQYTAPGTYLYQVRELVPADPMEYMIYSDKVINVEVKVRENGASKLKTTVTYPDGEDTFVNVYQISGSIW